MIVFDIMLKLEEEFFKGVILEVNFFVFVVLLYSLLVDLLILVVLELDVVVVVEDWIFKLEILFMVRFLFLSFLVNVFMWIEELRWWEGLIFLIRNLGFIMLLGFKFLFL